MKHKYQGNSQGSKVSNMILHKVQWGNNRWGGKVGKQEPFEEGEDLLRPAKLSEVIPNKEVYFIRPNNKGEDYYLLLGGFHTSTEYQTIKDFIKAKTVYVRLDFKKQYGKHK